MTTNDYITLALSGLALIVSVVSVMISIRQARTETREQLNGLVQELLKTQSDGPGPITMPKLASLGRQAAAIFEQDPEVVTDVDYCVVAQGFATLGDVPRAEQNWQRAVDASPSDFYRVMNKRGYASYLFCIGKHEPGRRFYKEALEIFDPTTDFNKSTNGYTYQMWFFSEAWNVSFSSREAENYYERAQALFGSISSAQWRSNALNELEKLRSKLVSDIENLMRQSPRPSGIPDAFLPPQGPKI